MPSDHINKFLGALTQEETATAARRALGMLDNDTGLRTVLDWAKAEHLLEELRDAIEEEDIDGDDATEEDEEEDEEDEDDEEVEEIR